MDYQLDNLTEFERRAMLRFLLYNMGQDARHKLMLAMPVAYVKLAPHAAETVAEYVRRELVAIKE